MLTHDGQVVVGPVSAWLRETLQNSYSLSYLTAQSAGLYTGATQAVVKEGNAVRIDGAVYQVRQIVEGSVLCSVGEQDAAADWVELTAEDAAELLVEDRADEGTHRPLMCVWCGICGCDEAGGRGCTR